MKMKSHQASKKEESKYLREDKAILIKGSVIATIIALIPFIFSIHESVPNKKTWSTFLFTYESAYFEDAQVAMWTLTGKLIPLVLLFIWFFTCRHWWYHVLLIPIFMYIRQIISMFSNEDVLDNQEMVYMLPAMAIIIPTIYLIRARMFNKMINASKTLEQLEDEFKMSPKNIWQKIKQYF
jgi:hypothetical protein